MTNKTSCIVLIILSFLLQCTETVSGGGGSETTNSITVCVKGNELSGKAVPSANVQLFWQYSGWEAYAAYSYQSEFLEGIQDFGNNPYEQDYEFVDLNVRRKLWGGATASLQVQNLFDNHTYWYTAGSSTASSRAYIKNGRSISLGLTYVF